MTTPSILLYLSLLIPAERLQYPNFRPYESLQELLRYTREYYPTDVRAPPSIRDYVL
jgi:hypothetical protein